LQRIQTENPRVRIALLAPPLIPIPPPAYAGTERIIAVLADELDRRGHQVTLFAPGDSTSPGELVPVVPNSLWKEEAAADAPLATVLTAAMAWREQDRFDLIHSHLETGGFLLARHARVPVVSTLHGRLDSGAMPALLGEFRDVPLVAISDSQRRWFPDANWVATIHHGLPLESMPFGANPGEYLLFLGRVVPDKGIGEAVQLARDVDLPLRIVAKVNQPEEEICFREVVEPALADDRVTFLGELAPSERDPLLAGALATLMLGAWPEPFGLVAIESLGTGTPVIARRAGALPEIIEHGVDGFLVDDVAEAGLAVEMARELDRARIRERALERFSSSRMVDQYEAVFQRLVEQASDARRRPAAVVSGRP